MSEIQVGEYVRINKDIRPICIGIGKVTKISADSKNIYVDMDMNCILISYEKQQVVKHSYNIIDLIEERRLCKWKYSRNSLRI